MNLHLTKVVFATFLLSLPVFAQQHGIEKDTWRAEATEAETYTSRMGKTPPWYYHLSETQSSGITDHMAAFKFENSVDAVSSDGAMSKVFTGKISCTQSTKGGKVESRKCFVYPVADKACPAPNGHE